VAERLVEWFDLLSREPDASVASRTVAGTPTGTITFLFTDIVGSTRRWEADPVEMDGALARHDAILRDAVTQHGGYVFSTGGDGFAVAFARAGDAVEAAVETQRALQAQGLPPVRVGIHTGEAVERDGDYFGPDVNRAARLMAIGHGGQVLLSQATANLLPAAELRDLGEHRLRDLSRAERVFQIFAPELSQDFPPLRSLDAFSGNLPLQLTSFVGRTGELATLTQAVHGARLVTVIGVGGVGKTRVAVQAAADVVSDYRDGAWICELATANDAEAVEQVAGSALGVTPQPGMTLEQSIVEFLRTKHLLLVLDNCEHVIDPAGRLADAILRACPNVRVIATSREPLALDGEHIFPLRSLGVGSASDDLAAISVSDAARLFEDRGRAARPGFALDSTNTTAVGEICRRLDGIPLAIELAAARIVAMSPAEISSLLDERFRLLTGGRRGSLERHQTLRATVEWSYSLLEPAERTAFDRLAVFSGFDAAAARAVISDDELDEWSVLDAIEGLVRKSMLGAEEVDGTTRYPMLETLRQFAIERLDEHDELDHWRRRHAEFFAGFAEVIGPALLGPDEVRARKRLYADLDNLRAASTWALDRDDVDDAELGVCILAELAEDFGMVVRVRWALPSAERALDAARRSTPGRRAAVLASAAYEASTRFDDETALALGREALGDGIPPDCPSPYRVCYAASAAGSPNARSSAAMTLLEDLVAKLEAADIPPAELARVYTLLVQGNVMRVDFDQARRWAERAEQLAQESGNPSTIAQVSYHLGTLWARDEPDRAITAYERCIFMSTNAAAMDATTGAALFQCALLLARRGDRSTALADLRQSIVMQDWMKTRPQLEGALAYAMEILTVLGAYEDAAVLAGAARSGALTHLRSLKPPPERQQRSASPLREVLGDRFDAIAAAGAAMTFDELVAWILTRLDALLAEELASS
jgi:predicted ATPase/class 3 adenylate cyclase